MNVVYTAPNRGHHYTYANALHKAGCLHAFVSGLPRWNPHAKALELNGKLRRADFLQTLYIGSLKAKLPNAVGRQLAYLAKIEQDNACRRFLAEADVFLFYNGSGLNSIRYGKKRGVINVVEAVNSHVSFQENLLRTEHQKLNLPWTPFPKQETLRRLKEYEEADYILLPSEFVKRSFLANGFRPEKLLKVPYGFKQMAAVPGRRSLVRPRKEFTILYVGSLSVRKGVRYLVEAFRQLKHPHKKLVLVGPDVNDGSLRDVTLPENVLLTGVLKGKALEDAYQSADVFCLPSLEEGLALVLGEALSFGLPIIATNTSGADDVITDGNEGFLVGPGNSKIITEKLQMLADDSFLLQKMQEQAFAKASRLDGWDATGRNLVATLSRIYQQTLV